MNVSFILATNEVDVQWSAPLAFGYLKAASPEHEYSVARSLDDIKDQAPDVLGISCMSQDFNAAISIADYARAVGVPFIIMGGHHITAFPETLPASVDVGVLGEGERTFAKLMDSGQRHIPGVAYRLDGELVVTPQAPLGDIDSIAPPDRNFGMAKNQTPYLFTSRGCPFKCSFCASSVYWDKTRYHSPERVLEEINSMDSKRIGIWDDLFIVNKKRVKRIAELLDGRNISFSMAAKSDLIDDAMCQAMNKMNLNQVGIGAESGSDVLLKKLKTSHCSVASNQNALDVMQRHGIEAGAGFVFGHWEETEAQVHETYRWIMKNYAERKISNHEVNILTPMPGTPVWFWAEEHGHPVREWDRLRFLSLNANNLKDMDAWIDVRAKNNSFYLNEENVPQATLYQIIRHYEDRIKLGRFGVPGVRGAGRLALKKTLKSKIKSILGVGK